MDGCIRWEWLSSKGEEQVGLELNLGRPIVTNGDFATRLFPNYFERTFCAYCSLVRYTAKLENRNVWQNLACSPCWPRGIE